MSSSIKQTASNGFSLLELLIAMTISMTVMVAGTTLLTNALKVRSRENQKSDALADAQRALNIMSREIANTGFNLTNNGIVVADSNINKIRVRSNLNAFDPSALAPSRTDVIDENEDITYFINQADNTKYLARHDKSTNQSTVLANRVDSMNIHYFDQPVTYTAPQRGSDIADKSAVEVSPSAAKYIVIAVSVTLDAVGTPNTAGYQPPYTVLLCSDVTLRNTELWGY